MSKLHPLANVGEFLPSSRQTALIDANSEINSLIDHAIETLFPDEAMTDSKDFLLRGVLMRIQTLGNVMYGSACAADEDLKRFLSDAYGRHHSFKQTEADDRVSEEDRHG